MSALIIERVYLNRIDFENIAWCGFESWQILKLAFFIPLSIFIFFLNPSKILNFFKIKSKNANKKPKHLNPNLLKNLFCAFWEISKIFLWSKLLLIFEWFSGTTKNSSGFCYSHFNYFIFDGYCNTFIVNLSPTPYKTGFENIFKKRENSFGM